MSAVAEVSVAITADDLEGANETFVQIRKSLVRKLGGNVNAMAAAAVLNSIQFQMKYGRQGEHYEHDGTPWWRGSLDVLADWTGLARSVVHRMTLLLVRFGVLRVEEHRRAGGTDRTKSYQIVLGQLRPQPKKRGGEPKRITVPDLSGSAHIPDVGSPDPTSGTPGDPTSGISHLGSLPSIRGEVEEGEEPRPAAAPPILFPDQCARHQAAINDDPCGGCGRARQRHERDLAQQAADAAAAARAHADRRCRIEGHQSYPAANCSACRSEEIERRSA